PLMLGRLRSDALWPAPLVAGLTAVYASNWADIVSTDGMGPLLHTWSLSIEEQFYLLWPAAFVALTVRGRSLVRWLSGAVVLMVVVRAVGWLTTHDLWPYFATITHGDGLLVGCLLAVLLSRGRLAAGSSLRAQLAAWASAGVLAVLMVTSTIYSGQTYLAGLTLAALATAVIVRHVATSEVGLLVAVLSWRPLVAVGRVSYGIYLFHLPVFMLVWSLHLAYLPGLALEYLLLAAVTTLSWFLVERPAQRWVHRRWPRSSVQPGSTPVGGSAAIPGRAGATV
ncbi:MAG TPA: acyltransferase, partial [Kineosporiaceae bacterium]|nr:acyltransferase [Kineosporiaceae bacterium]